MSFCDRSPGDGRRELGSCRITSGMFFARCVALALAGAVTLAAAAHAAGGVSPFSLGNAPPPPPPPEHETGSFDVPRKPPIPVSFLSHDGGWITFQYPPSARDRVAGIVAQADD